jgi:hypothetical protein
MTRFIFAAAILLASVASAQARVIIAHPDCNGTGPNAMTCEGVAPSPRGLMIERKMPFGTAQKVYKQRVAKADYRHTIKKKYPRHYHVPPVTVASYGAPTPSVSYTLAKPVRYIAGRLKCAVNVNAALAERGIKGTGSALAKSFLSWGRSAGGPVPGAVIVSHRRGGGHVAIVSRVENGVVYAWNATGGQSGWREIPYRKAVIDYRVPS